VKRLLLIGTVVVVLVATTAGGCGGKDKGDKFTRDCTVRGGHVSTQRHGHGIRRVCLPPPGGWQ
jgi:hypothetical protein